MPETKPHDERSLLRERTNAPPSARIPGVPPCREGCYDSLGLPRVGHVLWPFSGEAVAWYHRGGGATMEIEAHKRYRVVVRFPWGERRDYGEATVTREADGTLRWSVAETGGLEPYCDVVRETDGWIMGWVGGTCDTTVVISTGEDAPEP